ncbi:uncharacterized protein UTRI_03164 [Ustilago trichophora]|uniref:RED-like N-terminal domain-containing protein n=1 Tax=Ustilago trichophora TaxID=86804 RepID=A0A5C3E9C4_9BASI|nr:uncharacterized protein UTRI_03164 [Ustilago trichophora]
MDQDAFRALVSTSSPVSGPSSSSSNSNRSFGKAHKRSNPASTSLKPSDLQLAARRPKSNSDYVDRAAARRSGKRNSEFRDVEALYADFEERIAAAETEEERQTLRDQISSVGGDAKYSVLVKGLDWALLAQNKAKIAKENGDGVGADGEERDLESAYQESKIGSSGDDGAEGNVTADKRSKEDIMEAIKRRREGKTSSSTSLDQAAKSSFRPIGFKPIGGPAQEDSAEYKWVNGKRMRKKKKHVASVDEIEARPTEQVPAAQEQNGSLNGQALSKAATSAGEAKIRLQNEKFPSSPTKQGESESTAKPRPQPAKVSHPTTVADDIKEARPTVVPSPPLGANPSPSAPAEDSEEEEDDIFADVGGWDGIPDTNDAEDEDEEEQGQEQKSSDVVRVPQPAAVEPFNDRSRSVGSPTLSSATVEAVENPQQDTPPQANVGSAPQLDPTSEANSPPLAVATSAAVPANLLASTPSSPIQPAIEADTGNLPATEVGSPSRLSEVKEEISTPKPKPKKSKWDDDDDADAKERKKKKKKKQHH